MPCDFIGQRPLCVRPGTIEENAYVQGEGWGGGWGGGGALIQRPDVKMLMGKDRVRRSPGGALRTVRLQEGGLG